MRDALAQLKQLVAIRQRRLDRAIEQVRLARHELDERIGRKEQREADRRQLEQRIREQRCRKVEQVPSNPYVWSLYLSEESELEHQHENVRQQLVQLEGDIESARGNLQAAIDKQRSLQGKLQALESRVTELKNQLKQAQGQKEQRRMDELVMSLMKGNALHD